MKITRSSTIAEMRDRTRGENEAGESFIPRKERFSVAETSTIIIIIIDLSSVALPARLVTVSIVRNRPLQTAPTFSSSPHFFPLLYSPSPHLPPFAS